MALRTLDVPRDLLSRILEAPELARVVQSLEPAVLHQLVRRWGLETAARSSRSPPPRSSCACSTPTCGRRRRWAAGRSGSTPIGSRSGSRCSPKPEVDGGLRESSWRWTSTSSPLRSAARSWSWTQGAMTIERGLLAAQQARGEDAAELAEAALDGGDGEAALDDSPRASRWVGSMWSPDAAGGWDALARDPGRGPARRNSHAFFGQLLARCAPLLRGVHRGQRRALRGAEHGRSRSSPTWRPIVSERRERGRVTWLPPSRLAFLEDRSGAGREPGRAAGRRPRDGPLLPQPRGERAGSSAARGNAAATDRAASGRVHRASRPRVPGGAPGRGHAPAIARGACRWRARRSPSAGPSLPGRGAARGRPSPTRGRARLSGERPRGRMLVRVAPVPSGRGSRRRARRVQPRARKLAASLAGGPRPGAGRYPRGLEHCPRAGLPPAARCAPPRGDRLRPRVRRSRRRVPARSARASDGGAGKGGDAVACARRSRRAGDPRPTLVGARPRPRRRMPGGAEGSARGKQREVRVRTESEFISENRQIAWARDFVESLPARLVG